MEVELLGLLQRAAGASRIEVEASTVGQLLAAILSRFGANLRQELMTPEEKLKTGIAILVNGRNINFLQGLETPLNPGDKVTIIPPAAGG
ncbi:hypothetical protein MHOCP_02950 [Moorella humiferrea]|uniref:MoaD family protein n=1 Tax=Neomoorella humiferrea TaxID=676965 RepID=UPI0030CE6B33